MVRTMDIYFIEVQENLCRSCRRRAQNTKRNLDGQRIEFVMANFISGNVIVNSKI